MTSPFRPDFVSATLKLTGWYLLILMSISIIFSLAIYSIASIEVNDRLGQLQETYEGVTQPYTFVPPRQPDYDALRIIQTDTANSNLAQRLVIINIIIFFAGGAGGYFLARRTLQPIARAHEAQSRFVSDASHELKTPLAVMKAELEVALRNKSLDAKDTKEILESNLEEVNKLSALAITLLQLSQLDHEQLEKKPFQFNEVIDEVVKKYDKTKKRIQFNPSRTNYTIYANLISIEELITILVDNALKYSPASSHITIHTSKSGHYAKFEITNTGKGIASSDLPHVFDRFYRADTARTKNSADTGHGLGLSLAKRIVELHGGELSATSALNHATTFTVLLPIFGKNHTDFK